MPLPRRVLPAVLLAAALAPAAHAQPAAPTETAASRRAARTVDSSATARASALVAAMTRDEKLALVRGFFPPFAMGKPGAPTDMVPSAGQVPAIPRLGIPALRESDASLGVANQVEQRKGDVATALPASLATAASFDPAIAEAGGAMIGSEARAKRFNTLLAGGVNLTRDPFNGRDFEYLSEDPLLSGVMAGASIRGVQSNHIVSTIKHYVLNAQETGRMIVNAQIPEAALRESDLLAFQIAIERGHPGSVMCAYNKVNGDWSCENRFTLTDVLRHDWKYPGWVMSDWGAVHSTVKAVEAGLDQESGEELDRQIYYGQPLVRALADGQVPAARLDTMVTHILTGMLENGVFDHPLPSPGETIDYAAHAEVAQRAAESGIVLLKNTRGVLPLATTAKRIVLVGGHSDVGVLSGGGSSQVRSVGGVPIEIPLKSGPAASFARITYHNSSPLKAIQALVPNATVTYVDGSDPAAAAAAARGADLAVVFATQWRTEAEDVPNLVLPDRQDALIAAVAKANPRTAVVLETGGPVLMPWIDQVPAVVEAWYPGQRGGEAIANVLFGKVNPSGRLPLTFPRTAAQAPRSAPVHFAYFQSTEGTSAANPASPPPAGAPKRTSFPIDYVEGSNVGYRWYAAKHEQPLFAFGHGLSYTRFTYGGLQTMGGDSLRVSVEVTNAGQQPGADVVQVYVTPERGGWPIRLAAFERVMLKPGEHRRVTLAADPRVLASWDTGAHGWHIAAGRYRVSVAREAGDRAALTATTTLADRRFGP